jgi:hypothetical protein
MLTCARFSFWPIMKKFIALGTECIKFWAVADEAKGQQPDVLIVQLLYHCQVLV